MNDLLEQFLIEARELVQSATDDLLTLEGAPADAEALNRVFRAFHTLKGSVGLFEFDPWFKVLHAAEDGLSAARAGTLAVNAVLIDLSLETLDATARWTDAVEATERLPERAATEAAALVERYRALLLNKPETPQPPHAAPMLDWVRRLLATPEAAGAAGPLIAVRYQPRTDCFFSGDDPLGLLRKLAGLLAVVVEPAEPWRLDDEVDVFACNLVLTALTDTPRADVDAVFRLAGDQVTVVTVPAVTIGAAADQRSSASAIPSVMDPIVAAVLAEQITVLSAPGEADTLAGRAASCARTATNALRSAGLDDDAERLGQALNHGAGAIGEAIAGILARRSEAERASKDTTDQSEGTHGGDTSRTLRVDAGRVDGLVALAGELVVARNALGRIAARAEAGEAAATLARALRDAEATIGRLTATLHRSALSFRLMPLSQVLRRFARPVREAARQLRKEVDLDIRGEDTEADKGIVDNLFEPLLHVLRNAVDHGLEDAETRRRLGKPPAGRIRILAGQDGDGIIITVADDGRGIDPSIIRRRAAERGLRSPEAIAALDDEAVIDLIFVPGFSTAENVGALSGRGVGMDAVRAAAERLGGRVTIRSQAGQGTTVCLHLPQTVALARIIVVAAGGETYGIAMESVSEIVRRPRQDIHAVEGGAATVLRGRATPVIPLADLLGHGTARAASPAGEALLLVVQAEGETVALDVDRFEDRLDAVVRPPSGLVSAAPGVAGTTILGDGRVLLVIDPSALLAAGSPAGLTTSGAR